MIKFGGACVLLATVVSSAAAAPSFSGNTAIAQRIKNGDAHVLFLGDSIQNLTHREYLRRWPLPDVSGVFVGDSTGHDTGASAVGFTRPYVASSEPREPGTPGFPAGVGAVSPTVVRHIQFAAQPVPQDVDAFSNRVYAMDLAPNLGAYWNQGNWANPPAGTKMHADLLVYANPQGQASGLTFQVNGNSTTAGIASTPISAHSPTPEIRKYTLTWDAQTWDPGRGLDASVRAVAGTTPTAGSNLIVLGTRFYTDEGQQGGFQMTNAALGGKGIDYYLNPAHTSDANLAGFVNNVDADLAMIWIGANDTGLYDKQGFKTKMLDLVARYKTARPDMQFALVSNYDLGNSRTPEFAEAMHEIAQNDPSVLFLNLYGVAGNYAFLNQNYLSDGIHPSEPGARYFADQLWGLIDSAATVPEPASTAAFGFALLLLRRGRRPRDVLCD